MQEGKRPRQAVVESGVCSKQVVYIRKIRENPPEDGYGYSKKQHLLFHVSAPQFGECQNNPEYDRLADAQAVELDVEKRLELMKQCQEVLARDLPFIPLYSIDQVYAVRKNLKGVQVLPIDQVLVREAYFEQ